MAKLMSIDLTRDELGRTIGGGIPPNSLILLEGQEGAGKSAITQRIVYGLLKNEYTVCYISTELNTMGFVEQMASLDYGVTDYLLFEKVLFMPMFPYLGKRGLAPNFVDQFMRSKVLFDKDFIVFDTFSFLLMHSQMDEKKLFQFMSFLKKVNSLGKTMLFTVDKSHLVDPKFTTLLKSICDLYWTVETQMSAGQLVRVIKFHRFKRVGDKILPGLPFKIEPGKGFAIEIASFS
ncbi:MAG: ATPase domain-containing protein [Candidatus Woesearchaeota archaeon]